MRDRAVLLLRLGELLLRSEGLVALRLSSSAICDQEIKTIGIIAQMRIFRQLFTKDISLE